MGKRFIFYGLTGFCLEVLWTGLFSGIKGDVRLTGHTYIWMFFIYGLAVFLEPVHDRIRYLPIILRGSIYMIFIFAVEFVSGLFLKNIIGVCPWNYSDLPFSVFGLITFSFAPIWFLVGLLFEKAHDLLVRTNINLKNYS